MIFIKYNIHSVVFSTKQAFETLRTTHGCVKLKVRKASQDILTLTNTGTGGTTQAGHIPLLNTVGMFGFGWDLLVEVFNFYLIIV